VNRLVRVDVRRLDSGLPLPAYAHLGDAGLDLRSAIDISLTPGQRAAIPTGIALAIPEGFVAFVQPRSGLALNDGLGIANSPGVVDSGYRGEVMVVAVNLDPVEVIHVLRGDRIAQLVLVPIAQAELREVETLDSSERGMRGHGSTGRQ